jgi:tetratricopeptide (TPR) repeat protein
MRRILTPASLAALVGLMAVRLAGAADTWVEVQSPNFTVASNASEKKARNIAWQFEQVRSALEKGWPWANVHLDRPVLILAAKDEDTMRALAPEYFGRGKDGIASLLITGPDEHFVGLRADVEEEGQGLQPYRLAYWNYCTIVLDQSFKQGLPLWISRGMAAVISNTIVSGQEVHFGRPLPYLAERVRNGALVSVPQLIALTREAWNALSADQRDAYDAQSWALVQFLIFGDPQSRMDAISTAVLGGATSESAIQQTFGSLETLDTAYRLYVHQGVFRFGRLPVNAEVEPEKYPSRALTAAQVAGTKAAYLAASGRPEEARTQIDLAKGADPTLALPYDVEASLFLRSDPATRDPAAERAALEKAVALQSTNAFTYYRLASLTLSANTPEARAAARPLLERAVQLNDRYTPAYGMLANLLTQAGDEHAIETLVKAITLEPGSLALRLQLANALLRFSAWGEAIKIATDAMPLATTPQQRAQLQQAIDYANRASTAQAGRGAPGR